MGLPLSNDGMPAKLHGTIYVYRNALNAAKQPKAIIFGPYSMSRAPASASTAIGQVPTVDADEVWFFTPGCNIQFNDVVRRIETQQTWNVVDVKDMPSRLLIYVKRSGVATTGNK